MGRWSWGFAGACWGTERPRKTRSRPHSWSWHARRGRSRGASTFEVAVRRRPACGEGSPCPRNAPAGEGETAGCHATDRITRSGRHERASRHRGRGAGPPAGSVPLGRHPLRIGGALSSGSRREPRRGRGDPLEPPGPRQGTAEGSSHPPGSGPVGRDPGLVPRPRGSRGDRAPRVAEATIRVAALAAAGSSTAGVVSASVATLTQGVLKAMLIAKLKGIALGLVTLTLVTTGVTAVAQSGGEVGQSPGSPDSRLEAVERKLDKLLEVLGGSGRASTPRPHPRRAGTGAEARGRSCRARAARATRRLLCRPCRPAPPTALPPSPASPPPPEVVVGSDDPAGVPARGALTLRRVRTRRIRSSRVRGAAAQ